MNWNRLARTVAALAATVSFTTLAFAQEDVLQKKVDLFLRDADLQAAIQALTLQTGLQFVVKPGSGDFKKISLQLSQQTAEQAIRYICDAAGAYAEKDANGVFVISSGKKEEPTPDKTQPEVAVAKPHITRSIKLMKADPDLVRAMLKDVVYDSDHGLTEIDKFMQNSSTTPKAMNNVFQMYGSGQSVLQTASPRPTTTENVTLPDEAAPQLGGGGQPGGGAGGGGQNNPGGQQGGVTGLRGGDGLVPQGIDRIMYDPTDNSFLVQGTEEAIRELERIIEQFDRQPKQVVIKVEFVSTTQSSDRALGIDWLYSRGTVNAGVRPGEFARSGDPVFFNYATGNISTRLRTLMNNGWGRVVSAPLLRTLNNQTALVAQNVTTYLFLPIVTNGPGGQTTFYNPTPLTIQTFLVVRPRINNDNTIAMTLTPQIANITGFSVGPDGTQYPNFTSQQIRVATIVKNGETIALAGFTTKNDSYTVKKIPVLSDLPIIGQLFRGRNDAKSSSELVVFVTPNIVQEDELGLQP